MKILFFLLTLFLSSFSFATSVRVGSKAFTENYLLGEILAQVIEDETENTVSRQFGLQGTGIVYEALMHREIDMYAEYTGTLADAILKNPQLRQWEQLVQALEERGLVMSRPFGFNNTYTLAVRKSFAKEHSLKTLSDLSDWTQRARFAFTYEFMSRADGFEALKKAYNWSFGLNNVRSMDHALVYKAIEDDKVDVIETYSTDGKISALDLVTLEDDKKYFPEYHAVILARKDFVENNPELWDYLQKRLVGKISDESMRQMNTEVDVKKNGFTQTVAKFLDKDPAQAGDTKLKSKLWRRTKEHLFLVGFSLLASLCVGLPLGIAAFYSRWLGQSILMVAGLLQTIPSLALLCFLIPLFGIGQFPALVALFLYGLLPIVLGVYTGLQSMDPRYRWISDSLGLSVWRRLWLIELPIVSPQILAGIKTSAIIGIGTATLAALIGAGGYGAPIVTGLAMNDIPTILVGAIPAAVMALAMHGIFEGLKILVVPKGLR